MKLSKKHIIQIFLALSVGLYITSLTQNTFSKDSSGLGCLLVGWMGLIIPCWANWTWLANPLLFLAWIGFFVDRITSLSTSIAAFLISLSFLLCTKIADNEGGIPSNIPGYYLGYWLWLCSSFVLVVGNLILFKMRNKTSPVVSDM
ncbi:MAG: hypothetical protein NT150_00585 [Bacteroidetes bacterium]|nr:hypothetical protein [Bacteroidota bacterium]